MAEGPGTESSEPFERLAHETRLGIVRALGETMAGGSHSPLTFSGLQEAVGVEDNGKFNYHLSQILGTFVEKVDEGYRLTPAGISVFQAIKSGTYDPRSDVSPTPLDSACTTCGKPNSIWYENSRVYIGCEHCNDVKLHYPLPPGTFDFDDASSLAKAASVRISRDHWSFLQRVCPYCSGGTEAQLVEERPEGLTARRSKQRSYYGSHSCTGCYWFLKFSLEGGFREHPAVVSFFYERGVDLSEAYQWDAWYEYDITRRSTDPLRVAVTYEYDGDSRTLVVDGELNVVAVED